MTSKIRITITEVLEYEPQLTTGYDYLQAEATTVEHAFAIDKKSYEDDVYDLNAIVGSNDGKLVSSNVEWAIVDG